MAERLAINTLELNKFCESDIYTILVCPVCVCEIAVAHELQRHITSKRSLSEQMSNQSR